MKLTQEEIELFRTLSKSDLGAILHNYAERVRDYAFDSRNWEDGDSKESAARAAKLIEELIMNKIRPKQVVGSRMNEHE